MERDLISIIEWSDGPIDCLLAVTVNVLIEDIIHSQLRSLKGDHGKAIHERRVEQSDGIRSRL